MGLLGKADQTLVQGSRLYAAANVPGDMSKIYEAQAATQNKWEDFAKEVQTAWDSQFEEWHNFEETMAEGFEQVARNVQFGKTNDYMIAEVRTQVDRIKSNMKTLNQRGDKGNFEWVKLEGELNKLVLTTKDNNEAFNELVTQGQNKALQIMGSGNELKLLEAIMFDYNNNANTTNQTYVDGDIEYSLGDSDVSMTFSDLKRKLKIKDNTAPLAAGKIAVEIKKDIAGGGKWDSTKEDDTFNKFLGLMETPNDRSNLIHSYQPGLKYSIFEYVTGVTKAGKKIENTEIQTEIFDALISIGTDIDKDGRPDSIDTYLNVKNAMALQEEILNGRSGKNVIAGILTSSVVGDVEEWAKQYKVKNTPKSSGRRTTIPEITTQSVINEIVSASTMSIEDMNDKLKFREGGEVVLSADGTMYEFWKGTQRLTNPAPVLTNDREGVRAALYNLTGTSTGERVTPEIIPIAPTAEDIVRQEAIQARQKEYKTTQEKIEKEEIQALRKPNRESTTKKIKQIFNTSKGGMLPFTSNNAEYVTKAFQDSGYADAGMDFEFIEDKDKMKATWNGEILFFDTEADDFQSAFRKWFLRVVDPREVASFNQ